MAGTSARLRQHSKRAHPHTQTPPTLSVLSSCVRSLRPRVQCRLNIPKIDAPEWSVAPSMLHRFSCAVVVDVLRIQSLLRKIHIQLIEDELLSIGVRQAISITITGAW